jgi:hypothetical protein
VLHRFLLTQLHGELSNAPPQQQHTLSHVMDRLYGYSVRTENSFLGVSAQITV